MSNKRKADDLLEKSDEDLSTQPLSSLSYSYDADLVKKTSFEELLIEPKVVRGIKFISKSTTILGVMLNGLIRDFAESYVLNRTVENIDIFELEDIIEASKVLIKLGAMNTTINADRDCIIKVIRLYVIYDLSYERKVLLDDLLQCMIDHQDFVKSTFTDDCAPSRYTHANYNTKFVFNLHKFDKSTMPVQIIGSMIINGYLPRCGLLSEEHNKYFKDLHDEKVGKIVCKLRDKEYPECEAIQTDSLLSLSRNIGRYMGDAIDELLPLYK